MSDRIEASHRRLLSEVVALVGRDLVSRSVVDRWPLGLLALNRCISGGFPRRRFVEIHGPSDACKTSLSLEIMADIAKAEAETLADPEGKRILFMDHESALDVDYARRITGLAWGYVERMKDIPALWARHPVLYFVPPTFEVDAKLTSALLLRSKLLLSVHDSLAGMTPDCMVHDRKHKGSDELAGMDDERPAILARLFGKWLPRLKKLVARENAGMILINHAKKKGIGHIGPAHLAPWETPGGENPKFYADVRIRVIGGRSPVHKHRGRRMYVTIIKNKTGPDRQGKFVYDTNGVSGIDRFDEVARFGAEAGLLKREGERLTDGQEMWTPKEARVAIIPGHELHARIAEHVAGREFDRFEKTAEDETW